MSAGPGTPAGGRSDRLAGPLTRTVMMLLAVVLATTAGAYLLLPERTTDQIQLVVGPHPDDEVLALPALADAPGTYTVVVSLTRGEATSRCDAIERYLQEREGERAPVPLPERSGTETCAEARRDSWTTFLGEAASISREVRLGPGAQTREHVVQDARFGGSGEVWQGRDGGWALLSLPDGELTSEQSVAAIQGLLSLRGTALPDLPVARVVVAGYWNDSAESGDHTGEDCRQGSDCPGSPQSLEYEHPDHRAVTLAAPALAATTGAETWVNVAPGSAGLAPLWGLPQEPERLDRALDPDQYELYLSLREQPDGVLQRVGVVQTVYGWLAQPGQIWSAGERPTAADGVLFARVQRYAVIGVP